MFVSDIVTELRETERYALALCERLERLDAVMLKYTGHSAEGPVGEITRMKEQLARNRGVIEHLEAGGDLCK